MKKTILIILILGFNQICFGQNSDLKFLDYNKVITDIQSYGQKSKYYAALDYNALLYLDPDSYSILNKIKPEYRQLNKPEKLETAIRKFNTNLKNIEQFFEDKKLFNKITFSLSNEVKYDLHDIYIKSPNKAYYTISGTDDYGYYWSKSYGFLLKNGTLNLQYEYRVVE